MEHSSIPSTLHVSRHPAVAADMSVMRAASTTRREFRAALRRIARVLTLEASSTLETRSVVIQTPLEETEGVEVLRRVILVPILRAGLGMLDGALDVFPNAAVGHLGMYRNERTLESVSYYTKLPSHLADSEVLLLDPMLATGGSALAALNQLRAAGAGRIRLLALVAAPPGVHVIAQHDPDLHMYVAALDRQLDDNGYIRPGLGDAGDRLFGTE
ncbi:MAG: uracil phosphoribosyltransferase [Bacteroidia bacterium]|nr:uracil phosphoribosyltransferase [Bacteroidia bacterium]